MKLSKALAKVLVVVMVLGIALIGCNKEEEVSSKSVTNNKINKKNAYPKMIKVNGTTYSDTGFINSYVTCGTCDGDIKTSVKTGLLPKQNNESNFGKGYGYQMGENHTINVKIDDDWTIFGDVNYAFDKKQPYVSNFEGVAYFDGDVIQIYDDKASILLKITDIPERFAYIFDDVGSLEDMKPICVDLGNYIYPVVDSDDFIDKHVRIYFDGKVNNTTLEMSNSMECNDIYCIRLLENE